MKSLIDKHNSFYAEGNILDAAQVANEVIKEFLKHGVMLIIFLKRFWQKYL